MSTRGRLLPRFPSRDSHTGHFTATLRCCNWDSGRASGTLLLSGGRRIVQSATATQGYPRNDEIVGFLKNAIESFKQMADYGGKKLRE